MNNNDKLFELIKSLSQTEKGYIKKSVFTKNGEDVSYLKLFDALCNLDHYDEKRFLEKNKKQAFTKNFSKNKNQLFDTILKRLTRYHEKNINALKIKELLAQGIVLHRKGLFSLAYEQYEKALKTAIEQEEFSSSYEICIRITQLHGVGLNGIEDKFILQSKKVMDDLQKEFELYKLSEKMRQLLFMENIPSAENIEKIKSLLSHPALDTIDENDSTKNQIRKWTIISQGHYMLRDFNKNDDIKEKILDILKANPSFVKNYPDAYITTLVNKLNSKMNKGDYQSVPPLIQELKNFELDSNIHSHINLIRQIGYHVGSISLNIKLGNLTEAKKNVEEAIVWLKENEDRLSDYYKITLYNTFFTLYFTLGEYKNCIPWINKILDNKSAFRKEHQLAAKINLLILHYELKNYSLMDYLIRSVYREFLKHSNDLESEKHILRWIQKLLKNINKKESIKDSMNDLHKQLHKMSGNPNWQRLKQLEIFDLWLESKVHNRSIVEMAKEKYQKASMVD